jgi:Bifunctional DNA primase/polymerase, N-terminal/Primase C terminal 1 (PriCT-1)
LPNCNIGIATGPISKILVIDIDDLDAETELKKLETENAALPATVESITARGRHLFFKWPECEVRNSVSKLAPGIDLRANGGYVVAPPSLHPSGKRYVWSVDSANAFADVPGWLLDKISAPVAETTTAASVTWGDVIRDGAGEGCRNDTLARVVGHLLRRRVDPEMARELAFAFNDVRCRPPLPLAEVLAVIDSIAALELKRRQNQ